MATESFLSLKIWRKNRNYMLNNTELVLAVTRGQLEVSPDILTPNLDGAILITESTISRLGHYWSILSDKKVLIVT